MLLLSLIALPRVQAQLPVLPVLQNGFVAPGTSVAFNYGSSSGSNAYAGAVSWAPRNARFQLALGGGAFEALTGTTWPAWGARAAVPIRQLAGNTIGIAAFVGAGGGRRDTVSTVRVPLGVAAGWRHDLGATRGISVYAAPFFAWTRTSYSGHAAARHSGLRGSVGADLALARAIGLTVGYEMGSGSDDVVASGGTFGAGLSYAFR